jgi:hypothetical protein
MVRLERQLTQTLKAAGGLAAATLALALLISTHYLGTYVRPLHGCLPKPAHGCHASSPSEPCW